MELLKASLLISSACSIALTAVAACSLKQQSNLNRIIAEGTAQMQKDSAEIKSFMYSAERQ